jgi:cobalt/nickel transport system permease protein
MAIIGVAAGYTVAYLLYSAASRRRNSVPIPGLGVIAFLAAVIGTVCAAMGFVVEYAIGGAAATSLSTVATYMLGTHVLIGIGEGAITAITVMAVARARPDLVYLLRTRRAAEEVPA